MVTRKIDFGSRDWAAHAQDHWLEFAGNPNFPDYLRVVFVAYGRHAANGHAKLDRGDLARYLVRKDGTLPDRRNVWRAIERAVQLGYLLPESRQLCLVVGSHHVQGGRGNPEARCPRDHTMRQRNVVTGQRRWGANVVNESGRSGTNVVNGQRRSTLTPSLFSIPQPTADRDLRTNP